MTEAEADEPSVPLDNEEDDIESDEYIVEAIRAKRRNQKTGGIEYFIKWLDYPESQNTWEPIDNLKCPDLIVRFNENEKSKRKRKSVLENRTPKVISKKTKKEEDKAAETEHHDPLLLEDEDAHSDGTETLSSGSSGSRGCTSKDPATDQSNRAQLKSFERGLPIERIVGSCTDDHEKLWFFIKWDGLVDLELVEADEIEEKAPREMCSWYRERLYYSINNPQELSQTSQSTR